METSSDEVVNPHVPDKKIYPIYDDDPDWAWAGKEIMNKYPGMWRTDKGYPEKKKVDTP